jgi:hypothetical protein
MGGHKEVVRLLLEDGADPYIREVIRLLLEDGAGSNIEGKYQKKALHVGVLLTSK